MDILFSVLLLIISSMLYLIWSVKKSHKFFEDRNIPYPEPNLLFGNMADVILMKKSLSEKYAEIYQKLAPHDFGGIFTMNKPTIVIRDPDLIRSILIKDFTFFSNRGINVVNEIDPLSNSLFSRKIPRKICYPTPQTATLYFEESPDGIVCGVMSFWYNYYILSYEALKQMTYVDMIIDETLRKYPSAARLSRVTNKNYVIPNTNVTIPANTSIIISVYGLHSDEKYYDNPNEFRPERFTEEEKAKRPNLAYLPFGDGPRVCIAERFAKMQVKVGLVYALKNFSYEKSPKMKFPIEFNKNFGLLSPKDPILLQKIKL